MLRTVEDAAIQLKVSKTTIYNKLKLKEYKDLIVKKQGKSMIDDTLFNLIKDSLKVKNIIENEEVEVDENQEISVDNEELLNFNKELIEGVLNQLKEKDRQITELHRLIEKVDQKLQDLREKMIEKSIKEKESFFKRIFK